MKALVTGATGFVGSHIADLLIERGMEVRCIARKTSNLRWLENKPIEIIEASLSDIDSLKAAVKGVDYIFHSAGLVAARNYSEFLKSNRDGTVNLIEAAIQGSPNLQRFLYVSSQTAAGPSKSLERPNTEDMPCNPITSYGKSKKAAEDAVNSYSGKLPYTIVRPPAVYGPRDTATLQIFQTLKTGIGTMIGLKPKYISLVHSADLVRGIVDAAMSPVTIGKTYFVASEEVYNWDRLLDAMRDALGKKFILKVKIPHSVILSIAAISGFFGKFSDKPPVFDFEKGIDFIQNYWTCSTGNAMVDFGYRQQIPLEIGMKETVRWYREHKWL